MSYETATDELALALSEILARRQLTPFFQPIISLTEQKIIAYEALIRGPQNSRLQLPFYLFLTAQSCGWRTELERLCCELAIEQFIQQKLSGDLFLNLSLTSFLSPYFQPDNFLKLLNSFNCPAERIVLELSEASYREQLITIKKLVQAYKKLGVRFALDDMGAGYAGLRLWSELQPSFIKIDHYFCQQLSDNPSKKEIVHTLRNLARRLNCQIIAEGIETEKDYHILFALGIQLAQGYYFAQPKAHPIKQLKLECFSAPAPATPPPIEQQRSQTVACLIQTTPSVTPEQTVESVAEIFYAQPNLYSVAVIDQRQAPVGIVRRHDFMHLFLGRYGRELYGRKQISAFMDNSPLIVDWALSLEEASRRLTSNTSLLTEHDFIIADQGVYRGLGNVMDLLRRMTELQIRNARYANPLTQLPGNVPIYEYIETLLQGKVDFSVGYCDLDNFKPFNDVYGYEQGDQVIRTVAAVLTAHMDAEQDFIGHVGGDDFILVMKSADWVQRCEAVLADFEVKALRFYTATDQRNGGIHAFDRTGHPTFYPFLSLSIGAVVPDVHYCQSHHDVAALASEAKHQAKIQSGNKLFLDRRTRPTRSADVGNLSILPERQHA